MTATINPATGRPAAGRAAGPHPTPATRQLPRRPPRRAAAHACCSGRQPRWVRPLGAPLLLAVTAVLYLWNLGASGCANSFYAAAIQAGTKDWTALLFGSLDAGNAITVDKPPASLWMMALPGGSSASPWSILVPQALMGVGRRRRCCTWRCQRGGRSGRRA